MLTDLNCDLVVRIVNVSLGILLIRGRATGDTSLRDGVEPSNVVDLANCGLAEFGGST